MQKPCDHSWKIGLDSGVCCAACYQCLGVRQMLDAYVERNALRSQLASAQQQIAAMQPIVRAAVMCSVAGERGDDAALEIAQEQLEMATDAYCADWFASQRRDSPPTSPTHQRRPPSVASQILGMGVARFEGETREVATVGGEEEE